MNGLWTIYRRELQAFFVTPLAWLLLCIALPFNGFVFTLILNDYRGDLTPSILFVMGNAWSFWAFLVFLPPILTMRSISEESKSGILEFLLTAPVTDAAVVIGKLLAATTVLALFWSSGLMYGMLAWIMGTRPDWAAVLVSYFGAILASALFLSIGLVASAVSSTPLIAALLALIFNGMLMLLPFLDVLLPWSQLRWLDGLVSHIDVVKNFQGSFTLGVLDSYHVGFFLVWTAFFTFLAIRLLESRRWR